MNRKFVNKLEMSIVFLSLHLRNKAKSCAVDRKRKKNLPLNTETPNFVALFVFKGVPSLFILTICSSEIEAKREAILSRMSDRSE